MIHWRNIADMNALVTERMDFLHRLQFDVVCGVPRSGLLAASIIATRCNVPMGSREDILRGEAWWRRGTILIDKPRVLVVDDTANTGGSLLDYASPLSRAGLTVIRLVVYGRNASLDSGIFALECIEGDRLFEWNVWKHIILNDTLVDMDGVLCDDPTERENDNGPRYLEFIRTAGKRFTPHRPVMGIVTARLERYRGETENWLRRSGVTSGRLVMMNVDTPQERAGRHAGFKAEVYSGLKSAKLFIESSHRQASAIAQTTGRPVLCTETMRLY